MTTSHSNYLPQDILMKILHLLPFASLLKFKRVSKECKAIINDPKFVNRYHDKSLTLFLSEGSLFCVLVRHNDDNKPATDPPCTVRHVPIGLEDKVKRDLWLVSEPSDVVACVGLGKYGFLLYNLFTGASYTVEDAPARVGFHTTWSCYGFGYDRYADDHKITVAVKKGPPTEGFSEEDDIAFWIYSFRNRAWNKGRLEGLPYDVCNMISLFRACSSNGVLHWVFYQRWRDEKLAIVTYDLCTHRFGEMSAPPMLDGSFLSLKLFQVGGQLCFGYIHRRVSHVWVMKEYGVKESWAKLFTIDHSLCTIGTLDVFSMPSMALCEPRAGEKIVVFWRHWHWHRHLIWYDVKDGSAQVVGYWTSLET